MQTIEERIEALERSNRRLRGTGIVCGMLLVGVLVVGVNQETQPKRHVYEHVYAKQLTIVDDRGRPVVEITAGELGGQIVLRSAGGKDIVRIEADAKGGVVWTFQNDGQRATALGTYQVNATRRAGIVKVFDWEGSASVTLGTGFRGSGPVSMGAGCAGGVLVLALHDGDMMRVDLCLLKELSELLGRR